jgi:prepilin-type N-terminal cleavage/methylation domain-containing protein
MNKRKGITLIELIVAMVIITFFLAFIVLPQLGRVRKVPLRVICGTNLKGLGTAMTVYANDYDDNYPQLSGTGPWSKELDFAYDLEKPDFKPGGAQSNTGRTITASWYLLVREADVSPKSFVCPESKIEEFNGQNPQNKDIVDLWDFGPNPHKHVSYSMHNPYGQYPSSGRCSANFAVVADMSPWFKEGDIVQAGQIKQPPQIIKLTDPSTWPLGLSTNHAKNNKLAEGHNVTYADGHNSWEKISNVGVNKDNIFTFQSTDKDPTEQDIQGGTNPSGRSPENDAKSEDDSFLAI